MKWSTSKDLQDWANYAQWGLSSVYDLNLDGLTDSLDEAITHTLNRILTVNTQSRIRNEEASS